MLKILARWQCEKVGQVIDSANAERENKKKMLRKQRGYSALLLFGIWGMYPVVVIVMHMSKLVCDFVSCFCCVVLSQKLFVRQSVQEMNTQDHD